MKFGFVISSLILYMLLPTKITSIVVESKQEAGRCPASVQEKKVVGHAEIVFMGTNKEFKFDAKVDSGAEGSSLHAESITPFKKDGKLFVKFTTLNTNLKLVELVKPVSRVARIRSASGVTLRYFFKETVWIDEMSFETEINLANRSHLTKKFLIGKDLLRHGYLIDTTKSFIVTSKHTNL
jgi:hypothetical protein